MNCNSQIKGDLIMNKNVSLTWIVFISLTLTLVGCSKKEPDSTQTAPQQTQQAELKVKLFFEMGNESDVIEIKTFQTEKAYSFCYDAESFYKLEITGNVGNISINVVEDGTIIFKKESFNVEGNSSFSNKDFNLEMGSTYQIRIFQGEVVLFEGNVNSHGCN